MKKKIIIIIAIAVVAVLVIVFGIFTLIGIHSTDVIADGSSTPVEITDINSTDQTDVISVDSSMMDASAYQGKWFTVSNVVNMYLPDDWVNDTLTEEQISNNIGCVVHDPQNKCYMQLRFYTSEQLGGGSTSNVQSIISALVEQGYDDAREWVINGIHCAVYTDYSNNTLNVWIPGSNGEIVTIIFTNQSDSAYQNIISNIFLSISLPNDSSK